MERTAFHKGTVVISIDDGDADGFRLYENILVKHKLGATFNIVSGVIGQETRLTKEQLRTIYKDPLMEIAAHGYSHQNTDEDITQGIAVLRDLLDLSESTVGFASPGSQMGNKYIEENAEHLKALGLLYVRTAGNREASERHLEIQDALKKQDAPEYVIANVPQLTDGFETLCVNSVVVYHFTEVEWLKALVDLAAEEKACVVFMFHRVKKPDEKDYAGKYNYDYHKFEEFAEFLAQKRDAGAIEVLTNRQAFLKGRNLLCT